LIAIVSMNYVGLNYMSSPKVRQIEKTIKITLSFMTGLFIN
jgi:hypothetical protein